MKLKPLVLRKIEKDSYKCFCENICICTLKWVKSTNINLQNMCFWHVKYNIPNMKSEDYDSFYAAINGMKKSIKSFIFNFISE